MFPAPRQSHTYTNDVLSSMICEVLAAVLIKISVFWNISCRLACRYQYLERVQWAHVFSSIRRISYTQALFDYAYLNHAIRAVSRPFSSECSNDICYLEKGPLRMLSFFSRSWVFTEVLDVPGTSACTKLFNSSHIIDDLFFYSFTFHLLLPMQAFGS